MGFVVGVMVAAVAYPVGALIYCFNKATAEKLFSAPADVYTMTSATIPI